MGLVDVFYSVATGSIRRRNLLTPVGLLVFLTTLAVLVVGARLTDRAIGWPAVLPGIWGPIVGAPLLLAGVALTAWCVILFLRARGTPVPFNPPRELVIVGPYRWVRNPMLTGVFVILLGLGCVLHSLALILVWTPAFMMVNAIELKRVEEPELERRFGARYQAYRERVPMFLPRLRRHT